MNSYLLIFFLNYNSFKNRCVYFKILFYLHLHYWGKLHHFTLMEELVTAHRAILEIKKSLLLKFYLCFIGETESEQAS